MEQKYIWLFGENKGETSNNNSYYFWKKIVNIEDNIEKYFIMEKNKQNIKTYENLEQNEQKYILWRNSIKHYKKYFESDMFFVTLSYLDVIPDKLFNYRIKLLIKKPTIYLQHGTLGIKKIGYSGNAYNNNMFRFCIYNKSINEIYKIKNNFKNYQLYYAEYHPRYMELLKREKTFENKKQILWFLTWREYFGENINTNIFKRKIRSVIRSKELIKYLEEKDIYLKICVHSFFDKNYLNEIMQSIDTKKIIFVYQNDIDVMDEIAKSKLLITDYSSIGYDFTFLNKPVILFQPDLESYLQKRPLYCEIETISKYSIFDSDDLIKKIISEKYKINLFYKKGLPNKINYDYVLNGKHIEKMYKYFYKIQNNKITFIGYNFYGVGGTVNATRALAEGLLEKGYLVELLSLKKTKKPKNMPYGLNLNYIFFEKTKSLKEKIIRIFYNFKRNYVYLKYDFNMNLLHPYCGYTLNKLMKNIKTNTLISTRESLHLFLNECTSPMVKNKIYFFHCPVDMLNTVFPGALDQIKKNYIDKAIFVTEKNRIALKEQYNYTQYNNHLILGNALEEYKIIDKKEIEKISKKERYAAIYLLRISKDRIEDLKNLINYGKYIKENNIKNIVIDIFGTGNYVEEFLNELEQNNILDIIRYKGVTENVKGELKNHDLMIDLSLNHSFGMTYIEAVLNGKKVFCMKNDGSIEVMGKIPNTFIESFDDLTQKINNLHKTTKKELIRNYEIIESLYSREKVTERFIEFLDDKIQL